MVVMVVDDRDDEHERVKIEDRDVSIKDGIYFEMIKVDASMSILMSR